MPRYAAFLRGMNLGGRRISNADLAAAVSGAGFADVAVFRASGNVVLTDADEPAAVSGRLEAGLRDALGYEVPVYLRDADEVRAIAALDPFQGTVSAGKPQVLLLRERPAKAVREQVLALATDEDRLRFGARELHWLPRGPMSQSDLDLTAIGKLLGPGTMRTRGTIELIAAKHFADG